MTVQGSFCDEATVQGAVAGPEFTDLAEEAGALSLPAGGALAFAPVSPQLLDGPMVPQGWDWPAGFERAVPKRRAEYLAGRQAALRALARAGCHAPRWPARGGDGLPIWPEGWTGSISHDHELAVAVVARADSCRAVGIDLEPLIEAALLPGLAAEIMPEVALEALSPLTLTRGFSAKEALFKAAYPELREMREFSAARVVIEGTDYALRLTEDWGEALPRGSQIAVAQCVGAGRVLSLVVL